MVHQPKVDEYYDSQGTIARVVKVRTDDVTCDMSNGQRWAIGDPNCGHEFTRVRVVPVKPRRTLTLAQGLAWMERHTGLGLTTFEVDRGVNGERRFRWCVWNFDDEGWFVQVPSGAAKGEETPCKAIIAARKALKQVGK